MLTTKNIFGFLIINILLINSVYSLCEEVKDYCDCNEKRINFLYNIYCPRKTDIASNYNIEITVHSTNFELNCFKQNQTKFLLNIISKFNSTSVYLNLKHIYINNCLGNNTEIRLHQILPNLNIIKYLETVIIKSAELITIQEDIFFMFFNFNQVRVLNYENVTFTSWKHLNLMNNLNKLILNNNNLKSSEINDLNLVKLTQLSIENNFSLKKYMFNNMNNLQMLILMNNGVETINEPILQNLKFLKNFSLDDDNLIEIKSNLKLFENNTILNHLLIKNKNKLLYALKNDLLRDLKQLKKIFINCGLKEINQQFFMGLKETTMLLLDDNNLEHLPAKLFYDLHQLEILGLSKNKLQELPKNIFFKNTQLTTLDLSHNKLVDLSDTYVFQSLLMLTDLSLSYNEMINFAIDAHQLSYLETIYLDNNNLTFTNINLCPITNLGGLHEIKVDLSWNMISNLTNINCLLHTEKITTLILNGNLVTELLSSNFNYIQSSSRLLTKYVELNGNNITSIEFLESNIDYLLDSSEYYQYYDEITITYFVSISNNPIVCLNCEILLYDNVLLETKVGDVYIRLTKDDRDCRIATNCSLDELYNEEFICPNLCNCSLSKVNKELFIDCRTKNLTELPKLTILPSSLHIENINLDISNNCIKFLNFSHFSEIIINKLNIINVEHNQIDSIEIHHELTNLNSLKLASNKLKYLNETILNFIYGRSIELSVKNNPWYCYLSFHAFEFKSLMQQDNLNIIDANEVSCIEIETLQHEIKRTILLGLSVFLTAILLIGFGIFYLFRNNFYYRKYLARPHRNNLVLNDPLLE